MALTWTIIWWCLLLVILFNEIAAIYTVFREKRDIAATWAWLLVLTLIPGFGFILYAFFGRKLPHKQLARIKSQTQLKLKQVQGVPHTISRRQAMTAWGNSLPYGEEWLIA